MQDDITMETMRIQALTGRTQYSWPMPKDVKALLDQSINMSEEYVELLGKCKNCGIILNQKFFSGGCPNCNGKDLEMLY